MCTSWVSVALLSTPRPATASGTGSNMLLLAAASAGRACYKSAHIVQTRSLFHEIRYFGAAIISDIFDLHDVDNVCRVGSICIDTALAHMFVWWDLYDTALLAQRLTTAYRECRI